MGRQGTFRGAKVGFCFLDSDVFNSSLPGYSGGFYNGTMCSSDPNILSNRMGISIGMGDEYEWYLAWQWVDITGLPSGTYTLRAKVDPYGFFTEEAEDNQCGYAIISFTTASNAVTLEERAPGCINDWSGSTYAEHIAWMLETGISTGCAPELFCTHNPVTRGEMAAFLERALDLPPTPDDFFDDDDGTTFELSINRLAAAGITSGCGDRKYCPGRTINRGRWPRSWSARSTSRRRPTTTTPMTTAPTSRTASIASRRPASRPDAPRRATAPTSRSRAARWRPSSTGPSTDPQRQVPGSASLGTLPAAIDASMIRHASSSPSQPFTSVWRFSRVL